MADQVARRCSRGCEEERLELSRGAEVVRSVSGRPGAEGAPFDGIEALEESLWMAVLDVVFG